MDNSKRVFTVLCIDGGGARGLIPARMLRELETRTGKPISQLFDLAAAPSTGSILLAGLSVPDPEDPGKPKYTAQKLEDFYKEHLPNIFAGSSLQRNMNFATTGALYNPRYLDLVLERAFGTAQLKDALMNLLIPVADIDKNRPVYLENSLKHPDRSEERWSTMLMRDAVRSSSSAPLFFPAKESTTTPDPARPAHKETHHLIDGGLFAGSVPQDLLAKARKLAPPDAEIVFVHLGTGNPEFSKTAEEFNQTRIVDRLGEMVPLFVSMSSFASLMNIRDQIGNRMFSFDDVIYGAGGPGSKPPRMDDGRPETQAHLIKFAEEIIEKNDQLLDRLCDILTSRRISLSLTHEDNSKEFYALRDWIMEKDNVRNLAEVYTMLEKQPEYGLMPEHEKGELNDILTQQMITLLNKNKAANTAREISSSFEKFFDNLPLPGNENKRPRERVPEPEKKKTLLGKLKDAFFKACRRLIGMKVPELPPMIEFKPEQPEQPEQPPVSKNKKKPGPKGPGEKAA